MADAEIRAFGWRFLLVIERRKPEPSQEPSLASNHSGQFEQAPGQQFIDDRVVTLGFHGGGK